MPQKILVTGASGFIGSTLINRLTKEGHQVKALMRSRSSRNFLKGLNVETVIGDLRDPASLQDAVRNVDVIFHLAGLVSAQKREDFFASNTQGTASLVQAVLESGTRLKRFVFVSSIAASGPAFSFSPKTEEDRENPVSAYGESKLEAEKIILKFKEQIPITIVRPPIVYGPRDKGVFVFVKSVSQGLVPLIRGKTPTKEKYYSVVHVDDLCRALVELGIHHQTDVQSGEIFFISEDKLYTFNEIINHISAKLGRKPLRIPTPASIVWGAAAGLTFVGQVTKKAFPLNLDKANEILADYWICSSNKAKNLIKFECAYNFDRGMGETIDWYKQEKWI